MFYNDRVRIYVPYNIYAVFPRVFNIKSMTSVFALLAEFLILFKKCLSVYEIPLVYSGVLKLLQTSYKQLYSVRGHKGEYFKYLFIRLKRGFGTGCGWITGIVFSKKKYSFHLTVHLALVQNLMLLMHTECVAVRNLLMLRKGEWKQRALL